MDWLGFNSGPRMGPSGSHGQTGGRCAQELSSHTSVHTHNFTNYCIEQCMCQNLPGLYTQEPYTRMFRAALFDTEKWLEMRQMSFGRKTNNQSVVYVTYYVIQRWKTNHAQPLVTWKIERHVLRKKETCSKGYMQHDPLWIKFKNEQSLSRRAYVWDKTITFYQEGDDKHKTPSCTFLWGVKQMNGIKEAWGVKGHYWRCSGSCPG